MAKEPALEFEGKVIDVLLQVDLKIKLDNGHIVEGLLSGKMRTNNIKVILHDRVKIEMTPYDVTKGRITFRYK